MSDNNKKTSSSYNIENTLNNDVDRIHFSDIVKSLPQLLKQAPRAIKALHYLNIENKLLSLGLIFEQSAKKHPYNTFIHFEGRKISYKEFNDYSNKIANYLKKQNIQKGDVVSLLFENRPEFLICAVAVVKLGAIASLLNPSQRGQILLHSIQLVKSKAIIVGEELIPAFEEIRNESNINSEHFYYVADQCFHEQFKTAPTGYLDIPKESHSFPIKTPSETKHVHKQDSCFYIYTSGTTGMPKASITNHERWVAAYAGIGHGIVQLKSDDVFYCPLPFYHATAMLVCLGSIIAGGSSLVLKRKFSASEFWLDVKKYKVTAFGYVGELCRYLLNQAASPHDHQHNIRLIVGNGLRPSSWKAFKKRFGIKRVIEFYAASEGNVGFINLFNLDNTIGLGSHNTALVKYDRVKAEPIKNENGYFSKVKKGEAGLLIGQINNLTPFPGYTDKNQNKKAVFTDVFVDGDQWFNTSDLVRNIGWHHYQFVDRVGDTFRWKGENVSTTEVENVCMQFNDIADCIVYGVEIPETNGRVGMLSITTRQNYKLDLSALLTYLTKHLPNYAIPRFVRIKKELETTGTFKHIKADLRSESFHIETVKEPLYVLLPDKNNEYEKLTRSIYDAILNDQYRF
jgi:citronellyl-CoA synthetase